jgi:hypothetical protein
MIDFVFFASGVLLIRKWGRIFDVVTRVRSGKMKNRVSIIGKRQETFLSSSSSRQTMGHDFPAGKAAGTFR